LELPKIDLREKYQERYTFLPGKKVQGSSVIPLYVSDITVRWVFSIPQQVWHNHWRTRFSKKSDEGHPPNNNLSGELKNILMTNQ
jgi:hypothetical protein